MKKLIALLLAAAMLASLTACGGSAEPVETAPATTEPVVQATSAPTEEPTEAPTEPVSVEELLQSEDTVTVSDLSPAEYWEILLDLGYTELCAYEADEENPQYPEDYILHSLTYNNSAFRLDFTAVDTNDANKQYDGFSLYGTKADSIANISGINFNDYEVTAEDFGRYEIPENIKNQMGDYLPFVTEATELSRLIASDLEQKEDGNMSGSAEMENIFHASFYYLGTKNLYNVVQVCEVTYDSKDFVGNEYFGEINYWPNIPDYMLKTFWYEALDSSPKSEILQYGEFSFELKPFCIQCGDELSFYQYRPGMSFSDWACSELNTDGWIPWYGDSVLSPDRAYVGDWGYLDMWEIMDLNGGNLLIAEEYDGSISYFNNNDIAGVNASYIPNAGGALEDFAGSGTVIDASEMSDEELAAFLAQFGIDAAGVGTGATPSNGATEGVSTSDGTEAGEIAMFGNISVPVAHMVNAETPLFTPGFRIVSKANGRAAYHSVEMTTGLLLDDIIDIYMNGIADELIPHIKLYAFPESEEFMATLEGHTIFNAHPTPLEQGNAMLTIPEDAVCLTFQRVSDGQEAPNSPNPYKPGHENLNKDAVYARYVTKDDPNFGEGVNLVFAITFDDELVYWIHMGANFYETDNSTTYSMRY